MPYSASNRAIFIWIPKTAGTSLSSALNSLGVFRRGTPEDLLGRIPQEERKQWRAANWQHLSVEGVKQKITEPSWDDCYSFTFVRNPWDRLVSFYEYSRGARSDPNSVQYGRPPLPSFEQWVDEAPPLSQMWYLKDADGQIPLDFVGRFETLEADFAQVCAALGRPKVGLYKMRASSRGDYRDYYDPALRKKVAEKYAEEIEVFQYVF
ncbi:MAG: sulfotransferase family 2 domain-containing protein [Dehalococcoidia bacterium]